MVSRAQVPSDPHTPPLQVAVSHRNSVSVVLPVAGFANVARLVTAGFVSQLAFGFEAVDDLQLAIELVLRSLPLQGTSARVTLASDEDGVTVSVGTFEEHSVERGLRDVVRDGLDLRTTLGRLADSVEIVEVGAPAVVLRKRLLSVS